MTDPFLSDARELLDETFAGMLETLDGLGADQLNAKLDLDGANSLAVISVHATKSARSWAAVAMGAELPHRDRPWTISWTGRCQMPDDAKPATKAEPLTVICGDCGEVIELKDPYVYILAVHLGMNCPSTASLRENG